MSLSRRQLRTLRGIEAELASSDPGPHAFFVSFTSRADVREVPSEMPARGPWPVRLPARLRPGRPARRGRNVDGQADESCAENRNEP